MCEAATRGASTCARQLHLVCGAITRGARHVKGIYNCCEACTRQI